MQRMNSREFRQPRFTRSVIGPYMYMAIVIGKLIRVELNFDT